MSAVLRFTILAYGISWLVMVPFLLAAMGAVPFGLPPQWHGLAALGPVVAAYVMHRSRDPGFRVRDLYRRRGAGGVGWAWTAVLASTPMLFLGIALAVALVIDGTTEIAPLRWLARPAQLMDFAVVGVVYGFGEEPGWRGWLLSWLEERHNALRSTLIVALIWTAWHAPFLLPGLRANGAGGIPAFFIGLLAAAFWLTFLFNSTGGSVLAVSLWHMLWNAASLIVRPSPTATMVLGMLLAITGFNLPFVFGRRGLTVAGVGSYGHGRAPPST